VQQRSPGTKELWAPDISYSHGMYRLYYAYSLFGVNTSGIGLALNKTLDAKSPQYKWVDQGLVLDSKASDDFNAIDPNYVEDAHGRNAASESGPRSSGSATAHPPAPCPWRRRNTWLRPSRWKDRA
jgi:hypothetical protein